MILQKTQKVSASMSCSDACLSVMGTFQLVQDAITELTGELKIDGITEKEKYDAFWVFTKNRIKFFKKLQWNEKFSISAFISSKSLAKIFFDVVAKNGAGELAFCARVEACALDYTTQCVRKLTSVGVDENMNAEPQIADVEFARFDCSDLPLFEQVRVRSTNIDMSHHTNNTEYLRFILNTYSVGEYESRPIKEMEVDYISQSHENDILNVRKSSNANQDLILLEKDSKPVVKCEVLF